MMQLKISKKNKTLLLSGLMVCTVVTGCQQWSDSAMADKTDTQHAPGNWHSLFDGQTLNGWSGVKGTAIGAAWQVIDGNLVLTAGGAGDIVTTDKFEDFELQLEWKISEKGNSGIFYRVASGDEPVWMSGMEYQILDNVNYPEPDNLSHTAGAVFDLYAPEVKAVKPAGEFNKTRIIVKDGHVEHWLNDKKIVNYDLWSNDWNARFEKSKFSNYEKFGRVQRGYIALQDHGDKVWFKNIRIRELD